ncbi:MAG: hypothetical protein ACRDN0_00490, partial [Trebonia sp.]
MPSKRPTTEDHAEAVRLLLAGLARGDKLHSLTRDLEGLHPENNSFPAEVFMRVGADALRLAGLG